MSARAFQQSRTQSQMLLAAEVILSLLILLGAFIASVALGVADISPGEVYRALTNPNGFTEHLHLIIRTGSDATLDYGAAGGGGGGGSRGDYAGATAQSTS